MEGQLFLPGPSQPCDGVAVKNTSDVLIFHFVYLFEERIKLFLDIVKRVFPHVVRLTLLPFHLPLLGRQLRLQRQPVGREAVTLRERRGRRSSVRTNALDAKAIKIRVDKRLPRGLFFIKALNLLLRFVFFFSINGC